MAIPCAAVHSTYRTDFAEESYFAIHNRSIRGYDMRLPGLHVFHHLPPENATSWTTSVLVPGSVLAFCFETFPNSMLLTYTWVVPLGRLLLGSRQQTVLPLVLFSAPWNGAIGPEKNPSSLTNQPSTVHLGDTFLWRFQS